MMVMMKMIIIMIIDIFIKCHKVVALEALAVRGVSESVIIF